MLVLVDGVYVDAPDNPAWSLRWYMTGLPFVEFIPGWHVAEALDKPHPSVTYPLPPATGFVEESIERLAAYCDEEVSE